MSIQLTNSLSGKKENFVPQNEGEVRLYVCGPTVYGLTHIGNARPVVFFDVVRRYLEASGYAVTYVSNYTDVDDKIINRAREEKVPALELAQHYIGEFKKDMEVLGVRSPDETPRVTETMPQIIAFVEGLVKKGIAYAVPSGDVFFSVRKFPGYGKLSKKNIDDLQVGARVDANTEKADPLDFNLWKAQKADDEPAWDSPWGKGRPGWHIECSAMAMAAFGETLDIHGGGMDLMHPHHENEIAQSEGLSGRPFVRYWMHNNMLTLGSEKMSKSLGNIFHTRDFIEKHSAETLKFLLLSGHYRSLIDFSEQHIREVESALHRVYTTIHKCEVLRQQERKNHPGGSAEENALEHFSVQFSKLWHSDMDDDFNTAKTIGHLFEYVRLVNAFVDRKKFVFNEKAAGLIEKFLIDIGQLSSVLNIFALSSKEFLGALRSRYLKKEGLSSEEIEKQIRLRAEARSKKDFSAADAIRSSLLEKGIELRDAGTETTWDVVLK